MDREVFAAFEAEVKVMVSNGGEFSASSTYELFIHGEMTTIEIYINTTGVIVLSFRG